ncbi:MAG: hypothetical protein V3U23_05550, partial [Kiloniellales bacterium]
MSKLVAPHGSDRVQPRLLPKAERADARRRAETLPKIPLSSREVSDLFMLGMGAYTPLEGFMGEADWRGACVDMRLADGLFWPIPITLSTDEDLAVGIREGAEAALTDGGSGEILGVITLAEKYAIDKELECAQVYRTTDTAHPGVRKIMEQGPVNLAGRVAVLSEGHFPETYKGL